MSSRTARVRPTLNVRLEPPDTSSGIPDIKRRRLGGPNGLNGNGGTTTRSGTGPRTRGMVEQISNTSEIDECPINPPPKLPLGVGDESNTGGEGATDKNDSSSDSSSSDSSDSSDSEDSFDPDVIDSEAKASESQTDLSDIEKQFSFLKELLYYERMTSITKKLEQVRAGTADEFIAQLQQLQEDMKVRVEVASCLRDYRLLNLSHKCKAERMGAKQTLESDKALLLDELKLAIEDKIHRLEQDRNNDFSSEYWLDRVKSKRIARSADIFGEKKKKPVIVSGPYIVYMLHDVDIMEDWTIIKKASAAPKRKPYNSEEDVPIYLEFVNAFFHPGLQLL